MNALVLVGENGRGDEYGIGSDESFSIKEVAELFGGNVVMMPARLGNRIGAEVISDKTKALGWQPQKSLKDYIQEVTKNKSTSVEIKKRVLVFATTFYPREGLSERALRLLAQQVPDMDFDVVTSALVSLETKDMPTNINVHRIGEGGDIDKLKLMWTGHKKALELAEQNQYAFVWSVMSSYGTLPAYILKRQLGLPLLITLGDQRIPKKTSFKYWLLRLLASRGDQVSTNALTEVNVTRYSYLESLGTTNKNGDTFSNAFRFAYNMTLKGLLKK
jgi:hypothetical protein